MLKKIVFACAVALVTACSPVTPAQAADTVTVVEVAPAAPPTERAEVIVVSPGPSYVWARGHWYWNSVQWVWVRGHYIIGRPGWRWAHPTYVVRGPYWHRHWHYVPGRWVR